MPHRTLSAYGLINGKTAVNKIPHGILNNNDSCIAAENLVVYHYTMIEDSGLAENSPYVICPDSIDVDKTQNTTDPTKSKRWILISQKHFTTDIDLQKGKKLITNIIQAKDDDGIGIVNASNIGLLVDDAGNVNIDQDIKVTDQIVSLTDMQPPFEVNSSLMVEKLNVEFIGGYTAEELLAQGGGGGTGVDFRTDSLSLIEGVTQTTVVFDTPMSVLDYEIFTEITNVTDAIPSVYSTIVIEKQFDRFTITFSDEIDTPNYKLGYFVIDKSGTLPGGGGGGGGGGSTVKQYETVISIEGQTGIYPNFIVEENKVMVFINGVYQMKTSYTVPDNSTIVLTEPLSVGTAVAVIAF